MSSESRDAVSAKTRSRDNKSVTHFPRTNPKASTTPTSDQAQRIQIESKNASAMEEAFLPQAQQPLILKWVLDELLDDQWISEVDYQQVLSKKSGSQQHPLSLIASLRLLDAKKRSVTLNERLLTYWLSERTGLKYMDQECLKALDVSKVVEWLPLDKMKHYKIVPLGPYIGHYTGSHTGHNNNQQNRTAQKEPTTQPFLVATCQPFVDGWKPFINIPRKQLQNIQTVLMEPQCLDSFINVLEGEASTQVLSPKLKLKSQSLDSQSSVAQHTDIKNKETDSEKSDQWKTKVTPLTASMMLSPALQALWESAEHSPFAVREWGSEFLTEVIRHAVLHRASEVQWLPNAQQVLLQYRVDGCYQTVLTCSLSLLKAFIFEMTRQRCLSHQKNRQGKSGQGHCSVTEGERLTLRFSTLVTPHGEKLQIRFYDPDILLKNYEELGFQAEQAVLWKKLLSVTQGLIIISGARDSGITTTLYRSVEDGVLEHQHLYSIEHLIEHIDPRWSQMQVSGWDEAQRLNGIKEVLDQSPDVLMLNLRYPKEAQIAVQAALDGQKVIATLASEDAVGVVERLLDWGVEPYVLKYALKGVLSQCLVRTLCPHCKRPAAVSEEDWNRLTQPWKSSVPEKVCQAQGCEKCNHSGYMGRTGLFELFTMSESLSKLLDTTTDFKRFRQKAIKEGMKTLRLNGAQKISYGMTTVEEVMKLTP